MTTPNGLSEEKGTWAVGGKDVPTRTVGFSEEAGAWAVLDGDEVVSWHETEGAAVLAALTAKTRPDETVPERDARLDHAIASRHYWVGALLALERGRLAEMQEQADRARGAELAASPDGALLAAVFNMPPADLYAVEAGVRISIVQAREARAAVLGKLAELEDEI